MCPFATLLTCQKKSARGHHTAKLQYTVASSENRVSKDLSTHAEESISSLESLQKASKRAQSHVFVSYEKCGGLGNVGVIVKHAL